MRILFIGDIVGKIGRRIVKEKTPYFISKYGIDFVIANGENATHGKGLIRHHYNEIIDAGVDVITLGNHYDSKSELARYIERVDCLVRPANLIRNYTNEATQMKKDENGVIIPTTIAKKIIDKVVEISPLFASATRYNAKGNVIVPKVEGKV